MDIGAEIQAAALRFGQICKRIASETPGPLPIGEVDAYLDEDSPGVIFVMADIGDGTEMVEIPGAAAAWSAQLQRYIELLFRESGRRVLGRRAEHEPV
jgi:hypothetical protein